jgi:hypothetical protein
LAATDALGATSSMMSPRWVAGDAPGMLYWYDGLPALRQGFRLGAEERRRRPADRGLALVERLLRLVLGIGLNEGVVIETDRPIDR